MKVVQEISTFGASKKTDEEVADISNLPNRALGEALTTKLTTYWSDSLGQRWTKQLLLSPI
jgi:hypothetical protein